MFSGICQESKFGRITLDRSLQQLIADSLGEDRGHDSSRPLCRIEDHLLSSLHHHIVEEKDGRGHQEDSSHGHGNDQWEEVVVIVITFWSRIDFQGVPANVLI